MMIGTVDPEKVLEKAAGILNCDLPAFSKNTQVNKGRSKFAGLSGVENMHSEQRRNRALVWHDLFGDKPYFTNEIIIKTTQSKSFPITRPLLV